MNCGVQINKIHKVGRFTFLLPFPKLYTKLIRCCHRLNKHWSLLGYSIIQIYSMTKHAATYCSCF
jgi:hypothetical protein